MVKVAFIVEGDVEKIIVEECFIKTSWLAAKGIEPTGPVINVGGGGNLCSQNIDFFIEQAKTHNPDKIIILTDLECDPCITKTKERLGDCNICIIIIAKKSFEAWFLADDVLLANMTNGGCRHFESPELTEDMPFNAFKSLLVEHIGRGSGDKVRLAKKVSKQGFDVENAAKHPNCQSARYFVEKLNILVQN